MNLKLRREIKINRVQGKYKAISAYKIPKNVENWLDCKNCGLKPLVWLFNNGSSTACGCGKNEYNNFSIVSESVMSYTIRNNGSVLNYNSDRLRLNWNHWVSTGEILESFDSLKEKGRW